jgi:hypothetical protein
MGSWLSDLEKRKKEEEERKQRREQVENLRREQENLRELRLKELYETQYKNQVDSICECVNQLLSRSKAVGVGARGGGGIHATRDAFGTVSLSIARIEGHSWSSRIEAFLEESGRIKVSYRWHVPGGYNKSRDETLPIQAVTASVIEDWIKWAVSEKREDWFSRAWRRLKEGG